MHALRRLPLLLILLLSCSNPRAQQLAAVTTEEGIEISEGKSKILFYQVKPKSADGKYERANYVHPLYSLSGTILTEDFPGDHPHHRGIFWAWHQLTLNGKHIADTWSCENITWEVRNASAEKSGDRIALTSAVLWKSPVEGLGQVALVQENLSITVHRASRDHRLVDFDIRLKPLVDGVAIGGSDDAKGYGGFSVRVKLPDDVRFTSGQVVVPRELAVTAGPWMDIHGSFEDLRKSGVTIFSHPGNPGYPEPWILRRARSMQNPAFPGRKPLDLPDDGWRLRYRLVIHEDSLSVDSIENLYRQYSRSR